MRFRELRRPGLIKSIVTPVRYLLGTPDQRGVTGDGGRSGEGVRKPFAGARSRQHREERSGDGHSVRPSGRGSRERPGGGNGGAGSGPVSGLQCYSCNVIVGKGQMDVGCYNPEVIACSDSYKGFKHRFCIRTESVVTGIPLTLGCATSRHCQQHELPGVRIQCCEADLCNRAAMMGLHSILICICCFISLVFLGFFFVE
ncbi:hypothetical protein NDU88_012263 [Pleurodeles waltl]|uniref:Uncharacterized protein n=1 Tax=Pleurodeles waltl TaxID=8319 RepID=A0AAV7R147_PLEWA|nr:hypothetical protein NDU88_012263 [Pleurodeles waltl]